MPSRRCHIEFLKVAGTAWPAIQPALPAGGGESPPALESIFQGAGIELESRCGDSDLPGHPRGFPFDLAELHALMTRARHVDDGAAPSGSLKPWSATALLVPAIAYASGRTIRRPLGVMFDVGRSDLDGVPREGCAVAWNRVCGDPRIGLHTLAHELGHVFNLRHPHEESPPRHHGRTLMYETRILARSRGFPDDIELDFSPEEKAWLSTGPEDFVRPGGHSYGARPGWSSSDGEPPTDDSLVLGSAAGRTLPWQPVELTLRRRGKPSAAGGWPLDLDPAGGDVAIEMSDDGRHWRPVASPVRECGTLLSGGGEAPPATILLPGLVRSEPGTIHVRARVLADASARRGGVVSRPLRVSIAPPRDEADWAISALLYAFPVRLAVCLRGLGSMPPALADRLDALSREVDLPTRAPRLAVTLARHRLRVGPPAERSQGRRDLLALRDSLRPGPLHDEAIATLVGDGVSWAIDGSRCRRHSSRCFRRSLRTSVLQSQARRRISHA